MQVLERDDHLRGVEFRIGRDCDWVGGDLAQQGAAADVLEL